MSKMCNMIVQVVEHAKQTATMMSVNELSQDYLRQVVNRAIEATASGAVILDMSVITITIDQNVVNNDGG